MEFFETESIRLSMRNPDTGRALRANVYTLEGVTNEDGSLREMSIGQLVMAVCLQRATKLERDIVEMMDDIAVNSDRLDVLAAIEEKVVGLKADDKFDATQALDKPVQIGAQTCTTFGDALTALHVAYVNLTNEEVITKLEEQMDSLNTTSQELLIELQSLTSKRDDTYSLVSNALKSIFTVLTGNVNNL